MYVGNKNGKLRERPILRMMSGTIDTKEKWGFSSGNDDDVWRPYDDLTNSDRCNEETGV